MTNEPSADDSLAPISEPPAPETPTSELPEAAAAPETERSGPEERFEVEELVARRVIAQGLYLVDGSGLARASVQLEEGQAVQTMYDASGKVRARIGLSGSGAPSVSLTDESGQIRAQLYLKDGGAPRIGLADGSGKLRTKIFLDENGRTGVGFADGEGRPTLIVGEDESGKVTVRGADGSVLWSG